MQPNVTRKFIKARPALFFFAWSFAWLANAQVATEFEYERTACLNQSLEFMNTSTNAVRYEWDFCSGDLSDANLNVLQKSFSGLSVPVGAALFKFNGNWYGFITNITNNTITRLSFGASLDNQNPEIVSLGNFGGMLSGPQDVKAIEENGQIFLFVSNRTNNKLIRINVGADINNSFPTTDVLLSGNGDINNNGVEVAFDGSDWVVFYTSQQFIRILRLGASLSGIPGVSDVMSTSNITGANGIGDISIVKQHGEWYGFIVGYTSRTFHRLSFGVSLFTDPGQENITIPALSSYILQSISVKHEGAAYFAFVSTSAGDLLRMDFGDSIENNYTFNALGKYGLMANTFKIDIVNEGSVWKALTSNWTANRIYLIDFPNTCGSTLQTSTEQSPTLVLNESGSFRITLKAFDSGDDSHAVAQTLSVSATVAPSINFSFSDEVCVGSEISMASESDQSVTNYTWNFGDGDVSSGPNTQHSYSTSGQYLVRLSIEGNNGCRNFVQKPLSVFAAPVPAFNLPGDDPLCTNQLYLFENTSSADAGAPVTWRWSVGGATQATDEDFHFLFGAIDEYEITLSASIPGCTNSVTQTIGSLSEGPFTSFAFTGQCEAIPVSFVNTTTGSVLSLEWDFGDGSFSTSQNPYHTFEVAGTYFVSLTATSPNGCNNSSTQEITIFSTPTPDFSIEPPPLACDGIATPFADLTPDPLDSDITSWLWQFDESAEIASTQNPEFTFTNAGDHDVSLTVITDAGCEGSVSKIVTIQPSPVAMITKTASCIGKPTTFTATGDDIQFYYWEIGTAYYENNEFTHTFQTGGVHPLTLTVYGENNCVTTSNHSVNVPQTLTPNFSFTNQCVGYETTFADITEDAHDPIASREWNFAGTPGGSSSPKHIFNGAGEHNVSLKVTTEAGCVYSVSKQLTVLPAPIASFTASPEIGAAPLDVQFKNTSANATDWLWTFNDGTGNTSTDQSPAHTFTYIGEYRVELLAKNTAGCESRFEKTFTVVTPLPDVNLKLISTSENPDGSIKVIITLENSGNTFVRNLPVEIDISGNTSLTETIKGPIPPGSLYNLVLSYSINSVNTLGFLCAAAALENDLEPSANRMCIQFEQSLFIFHPYPNPARDIVRFEWLSPAESEIIIQLADSFGKTYLFEKVGATVGLNRHQIDVAGLKPGVYFIILKEKGTIKTHRIVIAGQN